VTCASTIVQFVALTFAGQVGATNGVVVTPMGSSAADAAPGTRMAAASVAARALTALFIRPLNTTAAGKLREKLQARSAESGSQTGPASEASRS
jgi:hypothetical protein